MAAQQRGFNLRFGAWCFLIVAIVAMLISFRYTKYFSTGHDLLTNIYLVATVINHFTFLSFLLYIFLYFPVAWFVKRKNALLIYISILATLGISLLILDTYVYDLYRFHINGFVLNLVFGGAFSDIFILAPIIYIKAFAFLGIAFTIFFLIAKLTWKLNLNNRFRYGKPISVFIVSTFFICHFLHAWAFATGYRSIQQSSLYYPLFYPLRANKLLYSTGIVEPGDKTEIADVSENNNRSLNYPLQKLTFKDTISRPNILFILMDAWQYETFNAEVTPNIYNFSKRTTQFTNHFSGSNGTRGGIFSLLYGLPPIYWEDFFASTRGPVFIDKVLETGYEPVILGSASLISPEFDKTAFVKIKKLRLKTPGENFYDRDMQITRDFNNYLDTVRSNQPFMGFLFYDSPHNYNMPPRFAQHFKPYWDHVDYSQLNNDFPREKFYNSYKNCVWFCDSLIQTVLQKIEDKNLLSNTILIISSDHGQEFNENHHNYWGHTSNYSKYQLQVPLLIYKPGQQPATINHFTSHYDVVPTLLHDVFNCQNPYADYSIGKNLYDTISQPWHIAGSRDHFAIIENQNKKINTVYFNGTMTVTDLQMNETPDAVVNGKLLNEAMQSANHFYKK